MVPVDRLMVDRAGRIEELSDGYALGVLEGEEWAELGVLLHADSSRRRTQDAIRGSEQTVALLAWGAPPLAPSARLRQRLLDAIDHEERADASFHADVSFHMVALDLDPAVGGFRGPARMAGWLGWATAAVLAGISIALGARVDDISQDLTALERQAGQLRHQLDDRDRLLAVIGARDSRSIRLVTTAPEAAQFRAYWSGTAGLVLAGNGVSAPAPGRTMQLWIVPKQGAPISAGVFSPSAKGEVLLIAANISKPDAAQALAISDEPTGGSPQPTTQPGWVGAVGGF